MQKAERIYSSCTFIKKVKGRKSRRKKNSYCFLPESCSRYAGIYCILIEQEPILVIAESFGFAFCSTPILGREDGAICRASEVALNRNGFFSIFAILLRDFSPWKALFSVSVNNFLFFNQNWIEGEFQSFLGNLHFIPITPERKTKVSSPNGTYHFARTIYNFLTYFVIRFLDV